MLAARSIRPCRAAGSIQSFLDCAPVEAENPASIVKDPRRIMPSPFANTPAPPYYAVIFASIRAAADEGYGGMAARMVELASQQPGFLGIESARDGAGFGITVSYWSSEAAIAAWKGHAEHRAAQDAGNAVWYEHFELRVAKVERAYGKRG
jgi:heme-degrading monooxygenase HmoA